MQVQRTPLADVVIVEPDVFGDDRGYFMESWNRRRYAEIGIDRDFVQDNMSFSGGGILRGLHFQNPNPQGKLVRVLLGEVFDVAVDLRVGSPTFGAWTGVTLSAQNKRQLYVPEGFAHGFCVTSDEALFAYKCTGFYSPKDEFSLLWNDPAIGIEWPVADPVLADKDAHGCRLKDLPPERLFDYEAGILQLRNRDRRENSGKLAG